MSTLPARLQGLLSPAAYSHAVQSVTLIETHISWVLLTGTWAYKIKRPVQYPFIDLRSVAHRTFLCREELRLNRRFAPELYEGLSVVTESDGHAQMDGRGTPIEHAVRMRQFSGAQLLDRLLDSPQVEPSLLESFGADLARIHARLPAAAMSEPWGRPERIREQLTQNLEQTAAAVAAAFTDAAPVGSLSAALAAAADDARSCMAGRWRSGRVRECHGDLHSANIVRCGTQLRAFDCLEFDPALRWMDVAQELATLLADLKARRQPALALAFLGGYLAQSGDYQACRLLRLYQAHRALVRAKVLALRAGNLREEQGDDHGLRQSCQRYLDCAQELLAHRSPLLILMHGWSGSGKTWLARQLAPRLPALHLSSDEARRRLWGSAGTSAERYSSQARAQVYQVLLKAAEDALAGGLNTIVDATFGSRELRAQFKSLAMQLSIPVCLISCQAPAQVLRARIDQRRAGGHDFSEADQDVLAWQQRNTEAVSPEENFRILEIDTRDHSAREQLERRLRVGP